MHIYCIWSLFLLYPLVLQYCNYNNTHTHNKRRKKEKIKMMCTVDEDVHLRLHVVVPIIYFSVLFVSLLSKTIEFIINIINFRYIIYYLPTMKAPTSVPH
jgi:hypothetical protein